MSKWCKKKSKHLKPKVFRTSDDLTISYLECVQNKRCPTIVLLTGVGYGPDYWTCVMEKFCKLATVYSLALPDPVQTEPRLVLTLEQLTQYLTEFLDSKGVTDTYLVGQGIGGNIALNFASLYPDRAIRIAISSTSPRYLPLPGWNYPITPELEEVLEQLLEPDANYLELAIRITDIIDPIECKGREALIAQYVSQAEDYIFYYYTLQILNMLNNLSQIQTPVLIMNGTKDPVAAPGAALYLRQQLPNSAAVEFYGYGGNIALFDVSFYNENLFNFFFVECDPCLAYLSSISQDIDNNNHGGNGKKCPGNCKCGCRKPGFRGKCKCKGNDTDTDTDTDTDNDTDDEDTDDTDSEWNNNGWKRRKPNNDVWKNNWDDSDDDSGYRNKGNNFRQYKKRIVIPCRYTN